MVYREIVFNFDMQIETGGEGGLGHLGRVSNFSPLASLYLGSWQIEDAALNCFHDMAQPFVVVMLFWFFSGIC